MDTALPNQIELRVVTPERVAVSATATAVSLPGFDGMLGILPGHAPLVSELRSGVLTFEENGRSQVLAVNEGFAEVLQGRVIALVQAAQKADEIDIGRAESDRREAEASVKQTAALAIEAEESKRARAGLEWSQARLDAAARRSGANRA